jgi:hypothetical protein
MARDSMHKPKAEKRVGLHYMRFRLIAPSRDSAFADKIPKSGRQLGKLG